jgi:hypothetical protein
MLKPNGQDGIEGSIKTSRLQNGFASNGCTGQAASKCRNQRWCGIHREDLKSFFDQQYRERKAGPAAQVKSRCCRAAVFSPTSALPSRRLQWTELHDRHDVLEILPRLLRIHSIDPWNLPYQRVAPDLIAMNFDFHSCC